MYRSKMLLLSSVDMQFGTGYERKEVFKELSASRPGLVYLRPGHLADESFVYGSTTDVISMQKKDELFLD